MFYYALQKKNGSVGKWFVLESSTIKEAQDELELYLKVNKSKKTIANYLIKSENEYNKMLEDEVQDLKDNLKLDDVAIKVAVEILELHPKLISKNDIQDFSLKTNTNLPYYLLWSWGNGRNGCFGTKDNIVDAFLENVNAYEYDADFQVFDAKTCQELDVKVSVDVKIGGPK